MAKGKGLVRRSREYWTEVVAEFEQSSLKQGKFCEQRGLEAGTFRHWLYRIRHEGKAQTGQGRFVTMRPNISPVAGACQLRVGLVVLSLMELPPARYVAELSRLMDR